MNEWEKAATKRSVLISGQEDVLRARAVSGILGALGLQPDDFDVQTFDAQSSTISDWIGSAGTSPFMGDRRVVIVRHLLQQEPPKGVKAPFGTLPESALIMLVADPVGGSDDRRSKSKGNATQWQKLVADSQGTVLNYEPDQKKSRDLVKSDAVSRGIAISERALDTLVEMTGGSLSRSIEELDKLVLYVGSTETISERHVEALVTPSREWNVFKLTDAIFENNPAVALRQLRTMVGNTTAETAGIAQILPQVSRTIKLIWQARVSIDLGCSLNHPTEEFRAALTAKPNLLEAPPYQQTKVLNLARKSSLPALNRALSIIADTDAKLKGSLPSFSGLDSLEMMVFELSAAMRGAL